MGTRCVRWTADTERAFLLALRAEGQVARAAAQIGRDPGVCYQRRRRVPAFAAAWAQVLSEIEAERLAEAAAARAGTERPRRLTRTRRDGWTAQRQRAFCRALADSGSYGEAAAAVGLSREAVRRFRHRSPAFQQMCDTALAEGGTSLHDAAYARAVEGWEEPVFHGGRLVGYRRRFSDTLLRDLLRREKPPGLAMATAEQTNASILRKLKAMGLYHERQARSDEAADAGGGSDPEADRNER